MLPHRTQDTGHILTMFLKAFHHVAIIASNYQQSKVFYTHILGLRIIAENFRENRNSYNLDLALPNGN